MPVPEIVAIDGEGVLAGLVRGVEEAGQAGETVEIDLDEIGHAPRDQIVLAVCGRELIVLATLLKLQHLEQRPGREGFLKQMRLFREEVEPEDRLLGQ
jgi:hypothetical protein